MLVPSTLCKVRNLLKPQLEPSLRWPCRAVTVRSEAQGHVRAVHVETKKHFMNPLCTLDKTKEKGGFLSKYVLILEGKLFAIYFGTCLMEMGSKRLVPHSTNSGSWMECRWRLTMILSPPLQSCVDGRFSSSVLSTTMCPARTIMVYLQLRSGG